MKFDDYGELHSKIVTMHLCFAHFMKIIAKDLDKHYTQSDVKLFLKKVMVTFICLKNMESVTNCFVNLVILLTTNNAVKMKTSLKILNFIMREISANETHSVSSFDYMMEEIDFPSSHNHMSNASPFYQYFQHISDQHSENLCDELACENNFTNANYLKLVITKCMSYFPSLYLRSEITKVSNAPVENFFGLLKHNILKGQRNLKCSRLIRKLREHVIPIKTELDLGIGTVRLTNRKSSKPVSVKEYNQIPPIHKSQEMWKRKAAHGSCKFSGSFLKNSRRKIGHYCG